MNKNNTVIVPCALALLFALIPDKVLSQAPQATSKPEQIARYEAEILIYVLPQGQELRNQGMEIGWELQTSSKLNQQDFFTFWVFNSKRPNVEGSVTIGYFSVNKHSAEVWDDNKETLVSTAELEGIQRILRQEHRIDESTVYKFSPLRPGNW
jgi:hypothetical protein